ncbi:MAG: ArnT family glycosyltransferase [Crocinitomicaceae bacterium]
MIFLKLGSFIMRWWDESIFAVNTYEMMQNGNYFSLSFNGKPDLFNTKPPLTSWFQLLSVKIFGYNELALRLPSAISAGLTVVILFKFISRHFNYQWAWISSLILLTSNGFIGFHTARTADSDSILTLFLVLTNLSFVLFILKDNKKQILLFFVFISLAFATKLYAAFLFIPGYLFILIHQKLLKKFIVNKYFAFGSLLFIILNGFLLYVRNAESSGAYFREILLKDAGRLINVVEYHSEKFFFYIENLFVSNFSFWAVFLVLGVVSIAFMVGDEVQKKIMFILLVISLSYLIIISCSVTKLVWYDMPLFPYLSIIAAYPIYFIIQNFKRGNTFIKSSTKYAIIFCVFFYPFSIMFNKAQGNTIGLGDRLLQANELYIFNAIKQKKDLSGIKVFYFGWNGSLLFYKYKLQERNQTIELHTNIGQFNDGDRVLMCNDSLKHIISNSFNFEIIDSYHSADLYLLKHRIE